MTGAGSAAAENIRIHERIDDVAKDVVEIKVSLARIESKMPVQPCHWISDHVLSHARKDNRAWDLALKFLSPAAILAALAALWKAWK